MRFSTAFLLVFIGLAVAQTPTTYSPPVTTYAPQPTTANPGSPILDPIVNNIVVLTNRILDNLGFLSNFGPMRAIITNLTTIITEYLSRISNLVGNLLRQSVLSQILFPSTSSSLRNAESTASNRLTQEVATPLSNNPELDQAKVANALASINDLKDYIATNPSLLSGLLSALLGGILG